MPRHPVRIAAAALAAALLSAAPAPAQDPPSAAHALGAARSADSAAAFRLVLTAGRMAPGSPAVQYAVARAHALRGDSAEAFAALARVAPLGSARDPRADSAFARWQGSAALDGAAAALAAGATELVRSTVYVEIPDPDLVPESIAFDPSDGSLYVGSMGKRKIVRRRADGVVEDFVAAGSEGLGEVIGIRLDPGRRELWVASFQRDTAAPGWDGRPGGWASVQRYALDGGRLVARHEPDRETPHLFNDIALAPTGEAYVTDSHGSAVYRVAADGSLERLFEGGPGFLYPNGLAVTPDGSRLYVAHWEGILTRRLPDGPMEPLAAAAGVPTGAIDGLYYHEGRLVGIQGGDGVDQVVALELSPDGRRADRITVLERRHPLYDAPTTGVMVGDSLLYIANSQLPRLGDDGTVAPKPDAAPTRILELRVR